MRITASVFKVVPAAPDRNATEMINIMNSNQGDIYLFPAYSLSGSDLGHLFDFKFIQNQVESALDRLCEYSEQTGKIIATSVPGHENIVIKDGDLLDKCVFKYEGKTVAVSETGTEKGFNVLLLPTIMPGYPCIQNDIIEFCNSASSKGCTIAVANGGFGESSADSVYKGFCGLFNKGLTVDFKSQDKPETVVASALDTAASGLSYTRTKVADYRIPYYGKNDIKRYLSELFLLQVQALYTRMESSGIKKAAVNVSGGLDSTLALLVAESAVNMLGGKSSDVTGLTLPCFSTSGRTNSNAKKLMSALGVTQVEIDIKEAVNLHLKSIGLDENDRSTTYENAQARERAQVLFDYSNKINAIAVGTGDMSEAALGFCTYAGDTLCHYNVNANVPKTVMRALIRQIADMRGGDLKTVLTDIVDTPISPELKDNQFTEDIIGPYEIHDFIMYYFAKHKMPPSEIRKYCLATFDEYSEEEIDKWIDVFFRRFTGSAFKRANACEGANILGFTLPYVPADVKYNLVEGMNEEN